MELTITSSPGDATSVASDPNTTGSPSSDGTHNPGSNTSIQMTTTKGTIVQETAGILPYAVGGAVGGLVVIIVIILMVIVSLLVRKRREKSHKLDSNNKVGLLTYNNALYDVGKETGT